MIEKHKFCIAPMIDYTDRHCRYFFRKITQNAMLYTEMVVADAIIFGDKDFFLKFDKIEHPVGLQIAGSDPEKLSEAAKLGEEYGYDEINLNLGCPSRKVQEGNFGACMMKDLDLVEKCLSKIKESVKIPVTVKCRIGLDNDDPYQVLPNFIERIKEIDIDTFIIHARKAILNGLDPKKNREIPPLDYDIVRLLKRKWPELNFILNGGLNSIADAKKEISLDRTNLDGVMLGRAVYIDPFMLKDVDYVFYNKNKIDVNRYQIAEQMLPYIERQVKKGTQVNHVIRHMLGLFHGYRGAKFWRSYLSNEITKRKFDPNVLREALDKMYDIQKEVA